MVFKDYDKYLSTSLKVYIFVLLCVFIMKLVGLNYFGLDINNPVMIAINKFCLKWRFDTIFSFINCFISVYIMFTLNVEETSSKTLKYILITFPLTIYVKYSGYFINGVLYFIVQLIYLLMLIVYYKKELNKDLIIKYIKIYTIFSIIQLVSTVCRNQSFNYVEYNFIVFTLMNFDYLLMLIILYKLYFMKGGKICHHYQEAEAGFSSLKKIHLKRLLKQLQRNLRKFRKLPKVEKLSISIYIVLSIVWNAFTIILILIIAKLNHTLIECLFIITSFWLSKHSFGKPFHLSSMIQCFVISNITYYVLNRITTPLGISIFVPILLGVGLSYFTSKFVKKKYKPLYKGMPEDVFEETILKVTDKNSIKYKVCYGSYIQNVSDLSLSFKYNYSLAGIRKIKNRINDEIRGLN